MMRILLQQLWDLGLSIPNQLQGDAGPRHTSSKPGVGEEMSAVGLLLVRDATVPQERCCLCTPQWPGFLSLLLKFSLHLLGGVFFLKGGCIRCGPPF